MKLLLANILNSPRPNSVEAPPDESQNREYIEIINSRPEELRGASRYSIIAQGLEEWEQQETQVVVQTDMLCMTAETAILDAHRICDIARGANRMVIALNESVEDRIPGRS